MSAPHSNPQPLRLPLLNSGLLPPLVDDGLLPFLHAFPNRQVPPDQRRAKMCSIIEKLIHHCPPPNQQWARLELLDALLVELKRSFPAQSVGWLSSKSLVTYRPRWVQHDDRLIKMLDGHVEPIAGGGPEEWYYLMNVWLFQSNGAMTLPALRAAEVFRLSTSSSRWLDRFTSSSNVDLMMYLVFRLFPGQDYSRVENLRFQLQDDALYKLAVRTVHSLSSESPAKSAFEAFRRQSMFQVCQVLFHYRGELLKQIAASLNPDTIRALIIQTVTGQLNCLQLIRQLSVPELPEHSSESFREWSAFQDMLINSVDFRPHFLFERNIVEDQDRKGVKPTVAEGRFFPDPEDLTRFVRVVFKSAQIQDKVKRLHSMFEPISARREFLIGRVIVNALHADTNGVFTRVLSSFECVPSGDGNVFSNTSLELNGQVRNSLVCTDPLNEDNVDSTLSYVVYEHAGEGFDTVHNLRRKGRNGAHGPLQEDMYQNIVVFLILVQSLWYANRRFRFAHNDLHDSNVMARALPAPILWSDPNYATHYIPNVKVLPTIIDYGRSTAFVNNEWIGPSEHAGAGIYSYESNPLYDIAYQCYKLKRHLDKYDDRLPTDRKMGGSNAGTGYSHHYHFITACWGLLRGYWNNTEFNQSRKPLTPASMDDICETIWKLSGACREYEARRQHGELKKQLVSGAVSAEETTRIQQIRAHLSQLIEHTPIPQIADFSAAIMVGRILTIYDPPVKRDGTDPNESLRNATEPQKFLHQLALAGLAKPAPDIPVLTKNEEKIQFPALLRWSGRPDQLLSFLKFFCMQLVTRDGLRNWVPNENELHSMRVFVTVINHCSKQIEEWFNIAGDLHPWLSKVSQDLPKRPKLA